MTSLTMSSSMSSQNNRHVHLMMDIWQEVKAFLSLALQDDNDSEDRLAHERETTVKGAISRVSEALLEDLPVDHDIRQVGVRDFKLVTLEGQSRKLSCEVVIGWTSAVSMRLHEFAETLAVNLSGDDATDSGVVGASRTEGLEGESSQSLNLEDLRQPTRSEFLAISAASSQSGLPEVSGWEPGRSPLSNAPETQSAARAQRGASDAVGPRKKTNKKGKLPLRYVTKEEKKEWSSKSRDALRLTLHDALLEYTTEGYRQTLNKRIETRKTRRTHTNWNPEQSSATTVWREWKAHYEGADRFFDTATKKFKRAAHRGNYLGGSPLVITAQLEAKWEDCGKHENCRERKVSLAAQASDIRSETFLHVDVSAVKKFGPIPLPPAVFERGSGHPPSDDSNGEGWEQSSEELDMSDLSAWHAQTSWSEEDTLQTARDTAGTSARSSAPNSDVSAYPPLDP